MSVGVLVAAGIGVAVFEGRNGKDPVPCEQARGHIHTIERLSHGGGLTADEVAQLHDSASRLTAIAAKARGDAVRAITDAATVAGSTTAGQQLDTAKLTTEFDAICWQGRVTGGSLDNRF